MLYDPSSYANINDVQTTHLHLDLTVDFTKKVLSGSVTLDLVAVVSDVSNVILDTRHVDVRSVHYGTNTSLKFSLDPDDERFGSALRIALPSSLQTGTKFKLTIGYQTTSACTAVQWLEPSQTVGKKFPYLFTQCQAIHARSLVPCQDSPSLKVTYSATIRSHYRALMSAIGTGESEAGDGYKVYTFEQKTKIPSYLLALAAGNLVGRQIGPRSTVWTEPEVIESAAWEFADTEKFVATGENLLTPYEWRKYDLLVLPPSFPYGGMENPCLTYVTPTLLAGDRSLVDVVAHEISHSWTGNLVTNANWEHMWLNEGWTVFVERKIVGRVEGEAYKQFRSIIGWRELEDSIKQFGSSNPLTALTPNLKGVDPDDSFSSVPYEKGFNFLYYIEHIVGGPKYFEPYMKAHVENFAGKSITTDDWKAFLFSFMENNYGAEKRAVLEKIDWEAWLHAPGLPPVRNEFDQTLAKACSELAERWDAARNKTTFEEFSPDDVKNFSSLQKVVFIQRLSEYPPLPQNAIRELDRLYQLTSIVNSEIRFRWQELCLLAEYEPIFPHVVKFVTEQGRMKFVRPLYRLLNRCKNGSELAKKTFREHRSFYHPIAAGMISKDIL
ncbi:7975_t:CDS:10 [Paraglomus brasilianum]|uniref:Leukotriene A(4) hydrolase n=1 Tax=Paraglomus brasilianum TaxID=144538 RepID=A0A9N9CN58_9GLOM|nr:7975_t:CDS:10 [Paraglomus brasilianum]